MKQLTELIQHIAIIHCEGKVEKPVGFICFDSRKVQNDTLFVATKGTQVDSHQYIDQAIEAGATSIVCEELPEKQKDGITYIQTPDSHKALGMLASAFYDFPSQKLNLVGVTGTNGKTTTVSLLHALFMQLGYNTGLLSTVNNKINDKVIPATHTTPDAVQLNALLEQMVDEGCTHCFMEVSSHALVQERVAGVEFAGAVFSNISHDHLDYHGTFDEYIKAKKKLFDELNADAFALVNVDDKRGRVMLQNTKARQYTFALKQMADFKGKVLSNTFQGLEMEVDQKNVWFKLVGDFNAYNLLSVYGSAVLLGEDEEEVLKELSSLSAAAGRFELVSSVPVTGIVDYAHTPDALQNVLKTINNVRTGNEQLITVVGCGGDRDKTKRPIMAQIAAELSDKVILTSDNPRTEDPKAILDDMQKGVSPSNFRKTLNIQDRREAIKTACSLAAPNDIILVAGKGHETYQEIMGVRHDFDDRKILSEYLKMMQG